MFSLFFKQDEKLQQAVEMAFVLHPERDVACHVARDGLALVQALRQRQRARLKKRNGAVVPVRLAIPDCALVQFGVYDASTDWEIGQETGVYASKDPDRPLYQPTGEDRLVRFLKLLIQSTANRKLDYVAVGFCSFLYDYPYAQICDLTANLLDAANIRRVHAKLFTEIKNRFGHSGILGNEQTSLARKPPDQRKTLLVQNTLRTLAPQVPAHEKMVVPSLEQFYAYYEEQPGHPNWEGSHLFIDTSCAGVPHIVDLYNKEYPDMKIPEAQNKLLIPAFEETEQNDNDRFLPPHLTSVELRGIQRELIEIKRGRKAFTSGQLRVCVDGVEKTCFRSEVGASEAVSISLTASSVKVFAVTENSDLLLAVFPLCDLDEVEAGNEIELNAKINRMAKLSCAMIPEVSDTGDIIAASVTIQFQLEESPLAHIMGYFFQPLKASLTRIAEPIAGLTALLRTSYFVLLVVLMLSIRIGISTPTRSSSSDFAKDETKVYKLIGPNQKLYFLTVSGLFRGFGGGVDAALGKAAPSFSPKSSPFTAEKVVGIAPNSQIGPTEEEIKEALLKRMRIRDGQKKLNTSIIFDSEADSYLIAMGQLEKLGCVFADEATGYLCTYNIKYLKTRPVDQQLQKLGVSDFTVDGLDLEDEIVTRRFLYNKGRWLVFKNK